MMKSSEGCKGEVGTCDSGDDGITALVLFPFHAAMLTTTLVCLASRRLLERSGTWWKANNALPVMRCDLATC
jgi:hypothetical protein